MPIITRAVAAVAAAADAAAAASVSATTTETSSATVKKAGTETTEDPETTTRNPLDHPQKQSPPLAATSSQKNSKSKSSKSGRALRLAQAKEEMLKIQLQLAAARIAVLEAEESSEEEDEEQSEHASEEETWHKIDEWLEQTGAPPQIIAPPPAPRAPAAVAPATAPQLTVAAATNPSDTMLLPRSSYPQADTYYEDPQSRSQPHQDVPTAASQQQQINISELASAIALAAKAGQRATPRYHTELPTFAGSHHEWLSFRAAYYETAEDFTQTDNVARLRRSLRGRAKEAVENLLILNARAHDIMRALESRFGRPDTIAMSELDRLRALPRPTDNPRDVCIFASRVVNVVASLHALDRVHYLYSPEATKITIEKLTPALRYRWFDYAATQTAEEPDLLRLSRFLQREADNCGPYAQPETEAIEQYQKRTQKTYTTATTSIEKIAKCRHCATEGHHINKCPKFEKIDVNSRWDIAKSQRLCFRCLRYKSKTHNCKRNRCGEDGCNYFHHKLLHFTRPAETEAANNQTVTSTWSPRETHAFLKILPIKIVGPAGEVHTHALLDDGSTVTLIDAAIARQAGLTGPIESLNIAAIADTKISACESRRVKVPIQGEQTLHTIKAHTMNNIQLSAQSVNHEDLQSCEHLRDIEHHLKYEAARPMVLIGQDNWQLLIGSEVRQGQRNQPVASHTPLGWVLHGAHTRTLGKSVHTINHLSTQEDEMNGQLAKFFALESLLIEPKRPQSDPEERAFAILGKRAKETEDGHYEVPLLWKEDNINLPDNYENTLRRLHSIEKKIDKDSKLKKRYNEEMNALIEKGYAEPVPPQKTGKRVWYLPHFAVHNPMKPEKVRIVHDAAAKCRGVSLNDCLLTGPDLLQSLPGVLMRFRQHSIAVGADIKEMFMQVKVQPEDRDALRYLWRGDRRDDTPPDEYRMTSLIFGATCSPSIAIYVKNRNASKFEETHPDAAHAIVRNHYVDDYLHSYRTVDEAIKTSEQVRDIHRQAHYELRKWTSNSTQVIEALHTESSRQTAAAAVELHHSESKTERILGLIWNPSTDELTFNLDLARLPEDTLENKKPTKRHILKIIMSVFDPLGLASPVTVNGKKILQEVWRRGTPWDNQLDDDLTEQWLKWIEHLKNLRYISVPRCYQHYSQATSLQLHVFVDASETAYTTAIYWRASTPDGQVHVSLITAKARVAPLKITSIPRLELQAAVLGSRMAAAVIEEHDLKPESKTFWTDSRTVLAWLRKGARSYRPFVAHRIASIEDNSTVHEWRWIPTKMNVADEATREVPQEFNRNHRWFKGPEFLSSAPSTWPTELPQPIEDTGEEKINVIAEIRRAKLQMALPNPEKYSRWEKLLRITARVLQFIDLCRPHREKVLYKRTLKNKEKDPEFTKSKQKKNITPKPTSRTMKSVSNKKTCRKLEAKYLQDAEILLIRSSQQDSFKEEIMCLQNNKAPPAHSRLRPLTVELVNGIIKLKSRISAAYDITEEQKRPAVVDGNHTTVKLYIDFVHRQLHHAGVETTINEVRQYYWVLRVRPVTRMVIHRCLQCRIAKIRPTEPPTGDHPHSRVAHHERPFTYTGVDYFGPITVSVGRSTQKRYVALFTCLTTRAVHLEMAASLSTDSAIMCLRRLINRRGCPTEIWSDNGSNLRGADKELRLAIDAATEEEANKRAINWRFIPPGAPFMGGAWERLVRSVKGALATVLHDRHPSEEVLLTMLAEAEYSVNSRPLTHVSVDPEDPEAITPNHFLLHGPARNPTPGTFDDSDLAGRAQWRKSQRLADMFWARWLKEYLPSLQYRREPHGRGPALKINDVVLVVDNTQPRNTWPMGIVIATYPGADGVVRTADIRTRGKILRRATKKLVILPTEPAEPADPHRDCNDDDGVNARRE